MQFSLSRLVDLRGGGYLHGAYKAKQWVHAIQSPARQPLEIMLNHNSQQTALQKGQLGFLVFWGGFFTAETSPDASSISPTHKRATFEMYPYQNFNNVPTTRNGNTALNLVLKITEKAFACVMHGPFAKEALIEKHLAVVNILFVQTLKQTEESCLQ